MPTGPGRYRVMTTKTGQKVRLHFTPRGTVNEAKNLATGARHTPEEFRRDRRQAKRGYGPGSLTVADRINQRVRHRS